MKDIRRRPAVSFAFTAAIDAARKNQRRLDDCPRHRFLAHAPDGRPTQRVRCENCAGEMSLPEAAIYARGYLACGGDPRDVLPNWS